MPLLIFTHKPGIQSSCEMMSARAYLQSPYIPPISKVEVIVVFPVGRNLKRKRCAEVPLCRGSYPDYPPCRTINRLDRLSPG